MGLTSFGAARLGDRVFIYGGHIGAAHEYSNASQNGKICSIDLNNPEAWDVIGEGPQLQGMAVVAHGGKLFRIDGAEARNPPGAAEELFYVDQFASFDPAANRWTGLPPLPEPRSSFDACAIDGVVYVIGGWNLEGEFAAVWHETALSFDLKNSHARWPEIDLPPFQRRALAVGVSTGCLVVIGGMQPSGKTTVAVAIYDPQIEKWSDGPPIPDDGELAGFGAACCQIDDQLVATSYSGGFFRVSRDFSQRERLGQLNTSRFFHRLLVGLESKAIIIGGANMELGRIREIEVFESKRDQ